MKRLPNSQQKLVIDELDNNVILGEDQYRRPF